MTAPLIYPPRCAESATTTGTGNFTLSGAIANYRTVTASIGGTGATRRFVYTIIGNAGQACAGEWETGWGYLSAASTLVRDSVFQSSNSGAAVNFSAGTKTVMLTVTGLQAYGLPFLFGTGEDGDFAVSSNQTLTQDKHWRNVTFTATYNLDPAGYIIRAKRFDMQGVTSAGYGIRMSGANGGNYSGNMGGLGASTAWANNRRGPPGGMGGSSTYYGYTVGGGENGENGSVGGWGGRGGSGGTNTGLSRGGIGGDVLEYPRGAGPASWLDCANFSGSGGGGGAGSHSTTTSNPGGGGGEGSPGLVIFCQEFARNNLITSPIAIYAGHGGTGNDANSGSGGGGGGGFVGICCLRLYGTGPASNFVLSQGGNGNANGNDSVGGYGGVVAVVELDKGTETITGPTAPSGTSGGLTYATV